MEDNQVIKHLCGLCGDEWLTDSEYLAHTCPSTGLAPTNPAHLGPEFRAVQEGALQRGLETAEATGDNAQVARNQEAIDQLPPVA